MVHWLIHISGFALPHVFGITKNSNWLFSLAVQGSTTGGFVPWQPDSLRGDACGSPEGLAPWKGEEGRGVRRTCTCVCRCPGTCPAGACGVPGPWHLSFSSVSLRIVSMKPVGKLLSRRSLRWLACCGTAWGTQQHQSPGDACWNTHGNTVFSLCLKLLADSPGDLYAHKMRTTD